MSAQPLVSVVMIFLDGEPYLEDAIASVFQQTYPAWELLLVDDGSTDGSVARARRYAAEHPDQVRYFDHDGHQNHGMSASRNLGIRNTRGEYLAFLDADDVWLPRKLEEQVRLLEDRREAAMAYGTSLYWYSWTGRQSDAWRDFVQQHRVPADVVVPPPSLVPLYLRGRAAVPCPTSVIARTDAVRQVGGFHEAFRGLYEDQVFYAKMCLRYPVFVAGACWDRYRQHPASASAQGSSEAQLAARVKYLTWLMAYLREQHIDDDATWHALRVERWLATRPRLARFWRRARRWARRWSAPGHR